MLSAPSTPQSFIAKWQRTDLPERAASHEHFLDLCRLLGQPTPAEHDATGADYAFEKSVPVAAPASRGSQGGAPGAPGHGFADVWWRNKFGWEYKRKGKYKSLADAYRQLCVYREALGNPPLLIVSDIARTEIHTNFTGTAKQVHTIALEELADPGKLDLLRRAFTDPDSFRPTLTAEAVTKEVAKTLGNLAKNLHDRGHDPHAAAHFLMKCMFCLFAEDVDLLPGKLFKKLLERYNRRPADLRDRMDGLFAAMRTGGAFGADDIAYFNGGLFDSAPAIELTEGEIGWLNIAAAQDWGAVEPAIFGTLFERSLDPDKRSQIGAHYTSRDDILLIVEPVVMAPLRREWADVQAAVREQIDRRRAAKTPATKKRADDAINDALQGFIHRLSTVTILDPACGSGNFLYVAVQQLLNLEKEVITFAASPEIALGLFPRVSPTQLRGIEINPYAAELAQTVIWIGYLQWMRDNGFKAPDNPVLAPITSIENRDAILKRAEDGTPLPHPAEWPETDFIIGNPPFLYSKVFRENGLDDRYIDAMFRAFDLPKTSDLCCYWFELARRTSLQRPHQRVGLLATQGIRGSANRVVLDRIVSTGRIFMAWSDRPWTLEGAAVNVSLIGFGCTGANECMLDGTPVAAINADLTSGADFANAHRLTENRNLAFMGDTKGGKFDLAFDTARAMLALPNPTGKSNADVVVPRVNGLDVMGRPRGGMIIDFGVNTPLSEAALYEAPLRWVEKEVKPERLDNRRRSYAEIWWIHVEPRPALRTAIAGRARFLYTVLHAKHRAFRWMPSGTLPDHAGFAFARSDDYFFGVLHTAVHELWALRLGTQLEDRPRYTPTTCFETFPLPWPPGSEPTDHPAYRRIADAARELNEQRERWLNPPEWIDPIAARIDAADDFSDVPPEARPLIRHSAIMAAAAADPRLKKRTLTNLYNDRPTWLRLAHEKLDRAVLAAYAATDPSGDWDESWAEVWTETGAGQPLPPTHPHHTRRAETDEKILAHLLRLNHTRAVPTPPPLPPGEAR